MTLDLISNSPFFVEGSRKQFVKGISSSIRCHVGSFSSQPFKWEKCFCPQNICMCTSFCTQVFNFLTIFNKDNTNPSIIRQKQDRYFFKKGSKGTLLIWLLQLFYKYVGKLFSLFFIINKSGHLYKFKFK